MRRASAPGSSGLALAAAGGGALAAAGFVRIAFDPGGPGFHWPAPDHFRIVTLPRVADLEEAIGRIGEFLQTYRQD